MTTTLRLGFAGCRSSTWPAVISPSPTKTARSGRSSTARSTTSPRCGRRLEAKGHTLRSSGDTEVLVHLYEDEGTGMFSLLARHVLPWRSGMLRGGPWFWPATGWARSRWSIATTVRAWSSPASSRRYWPCPEQDRTAPARSTGRSMITSDLWLCAPARARSCRACRSSARPLCRLARGRPRTSSVTGAPTGTSSGRGRSKKTSKNCGETLSRRGARADDCRRTPRRFSFRRH